MILATATHTVPPFSDPGPLADTALFLDMDLSILGADDAVFDQYEAAVREEYSWADDATWNHGRAAVLESFLAREHIFHTEIFRHRFEAQARRNIARSLERLAHRAGQ
jgi:predicted metal-dependent HD superfamily phosphohydrolase